MSVDWRREDWAYAAATLVAAAIVGYLVAGNFGLVRTPFAPPAADGAVSIPTFAARAGSAETAAGNESRRVEPTAIASSPSVPTPFVDNAAPTAVITSAGGAQISATQGSQIAGTASDANSGVDKVLVTFTPSAGDPVTVPARVSCDDASRTQCRWSADVPGIVGSYEVVAKATDRSGNATTTEPQELTVVNLGSVIRGLTERALLSETGLLADVLGLLG